MHPVARLWIVAAMLLPACGSAGSSDDETTAASMGSDDGPEPIEGCELPIEIEQLDADPSVPTGFIRCNDGEIRRTQAVECQQPLPTGIACNDAGGSCSSDADCDYRPYGACLYFDGFFPGCACVYGCTTDADCQPGQVCACGGSAPDYPTSTQCVPANCTTDADCGPGTCALGREQSNCSDAPVLGCRTDADACTPLGNDCDGQNCVPAEDGGAWTCTDPEVC